MDSLNSAESCRRSRESEDCIRENVSEMVDSHSSSRTSAAHASSSILAKLLSYLSKMISNSGARELNVSFAFLTIVYANEVWEAA